MENNSIRLIQSVQRSIDILNCFTDTSHYLSINDISQKLDLNINTVRGLMNTLICNGLLMHDKVTNLYSLGFYFVGKADIIQKQVDSYIAVAKTLVNHIAEKHHVSASLQLVNQNQICSIYCAYPTNTAYTIVLSEYSALPLYATSSGKLFTFYNIRQQNPSFMDNMSFQKYTLHTRTDKESLNKEFQDISQKGYSCEFEEFQLGVGSIAVPILNTGNQLIASVSATFFVNSFNDIKNALLADLKNIAEIISGKLFNK